MTVRLADIMKAEHNGNEDEAEQLTIEHSDTVACCLAERALIACDAIEHVLCCLNVEYDLQVDDEQQERCGCSITIASTVIKISASGEVRNNMDG